MQPPARGAVAPRSATAPGRAAYVAAGLLACAGGLLVLLGCLLPAGKLSSSSLLNPGPGATAGDHWFSVVPVVAVVMAAIAGIALMAAPARTSRWTVGTILSFGVQSLALFLGYFLTTPSSDRGPAFVLGIIGGAVLIAAAIGGLIASARRPAAPLASIPPGAPQR